MIIRLYMIIHNHVYSIYIYIYNHPKTVPVREKPCFQASFMGGILDGPWFRKGDNVFLGTIKENKMTWVPGFNHPPCDLVEVAETGNQKTIHLFGVLTEMVRQLAKIRSWFENCFKNR